MSLLTVQTCPSSPTDRRRRFDLSFTLVPSSGPSRRRAERRSNRSSTVDDATVKELRRIEYGSGSQSRRNPNGSGRSGATFTVSRQLMQTSNEASSSTSVASTGRPASFCSNWSIARTRNYMGDELLPPIPPSGGSSETSAYAENQHNIKERSKCAVSNFYSVCICLSYCEFFGDRNGPRVIAKLPSRNWTSKKNLRKDIRRYVRNIQDVLVQHVRLSSFMFYVRKAISQFHFSHSISRWY
jgi:hypothetical protein